MQIKIVSSTLLAIGSVLIFSSWIAQNYYEQKWESEYRELSREDDAILQETYLNDLLLIEHDKLHREKPLNLEALAKNSGKFAYSTAKIMYSQDDLASKICKIDTKSESCDELFNKIEVMLKKKKYIELIELCHSTVGKYDEWKIPEVISARQKVAFLEAEFWNDTFCKLYVGGSIVIASGWILGQFRSEPQTESPVSPTPPPSTSSRPTGKLSPKRKRKKHSLT